VIPLVTTRPVVQLAVPAGTITVSPSKDEARAVVTSTKEQLAALRFVTYAANEAVERNKARNDLRTA